MMIAKLAPLSDAIAKLAAEKREVTRAFVHEDKHGDRMILLPEEMILQLGLQEGQELHVKVQADGSLLLTPVV